MLTEKENKQIEAIASRVTSKIDMKPFGDLVMKVNDKVNKNVDLTFKTTKEYLRLIKKLADKGILSSEDLDYIFNEEEEEKQ
jgi:pantoate kinase